MWILLIVLLAIYSIDGRLDSSFLKNVQVILRQLAALAVELNASETKLDSPDPISRVSATVNLCYHQVSCNCSLGVPYGVTDAEKVYRPRYTATAHVSLARQTRATKQRQQRQP